jgi:hypothetical protein
MKPRCLITGCDLVCINTASTAHGDLHQVGEAFIFNAVRDAHGETHWRHEEAPRSTRLIYVHTDHAFERRGVIVFHTTAAQLSDEARRHIQETP